MQIGYCANVHPGRTLDEVKQNLQEYAVAVKNSVSPTSPLAVGLWLSATAIRELESEASVFEFRDWLTEKGILPFTFNGFPFGDFHQPVVKQDVYLPTWSEPSRLEYTVRLAEIQDKLLPAGHEGTISTLPLGWPNGKKIGNRLSECDEDFFDHCRSLFLALSDRLAEIADNSGRRIRVCIEPEPGCWLDTCDDVLQFFDFVLSGNSAVEEKVRSHISVCHDVCHSAVMFEEQATAVRRYSENGWSIGKVQVSSAIDVDFDALPSERRDFVASQLQSFVEPRYLHQTSVVGDGNQEAQEPTNRRRAFFEDLPAALKAAGNQPDGHWRVHFHVPVFLEAFNSIGTTQNEIRKCIDALQLYEMNCDHFEIETYAWNVLPVELKTNGLANDLSREISWFRELLSS